MLDPLFRCLAHERRRLVLFELVRCDPDESLDCTAVANCGRLTDRGRRMELQHVHLPHMEEAGLIEWERDSHHVSRGPQFETAEPILESVEESIEWSGIHS